MNSSATGAPAEYVCNLCGAPNPMPAGPPGRETPGCGQCGSSVRLRSLVSALTTELTGASVALPDLPRLPSFRGLGMSDPPALARPLERVFAYTNTFYHQEPRFDVVAMDERHLGAYDFILTSEVLEHVPPPVDAAFRTLLRMLKPNGVLVMTVPYKPDGATDEHYPALGDFAIATLRGQSVLVNRAPGGDLQVFENLVFHGGGGSTLEMRVFSEAGLRQTLAGAGFEDVRICAADDPAHGVLHNETWSLPVVARRAPFAFRRESAGEIVREHVALRRRLRLVEAELDRVRAWSGQMEADLTRQLAECLAWGRDLERQLEERTRWAMSLDQEMGEQKAAFVQLQADFEARTRWAQDLDREVERLRSHVAGWESAAWTRAGRKLGLLK